MFVEDLRSINFKVSVICSQETWEAYNDDFSQLCLDGYDCITNTWVKVQQQRRVTNTVFEIKGSTGPGPPQDFP